jgi:Na+/phosphate symporter
METKVELKILFSEKALSEIKGLYAILEEQFQDTKDYITTKNLVLKAEIKAGWGKIFKAADEYAIIHQGRLIAGVCMPQASYLYLDIVDSIKRISRGLIDFSEKV